MAARIPLSHVRHLGNFDAMVSDYANAMKEWALRPADWELSPPPAAPHPLVAVAAHVGGYEIVDDTPPPAPPASLDDRKQELAGHVRKLHAAAQESVFPPLKRPLIELQTRRAHETAWENRTQGDREALNNRKTLEARFAANELHLAEQLAAIHDLTDETIGSWQVVPFAEAAPPKSPTLEQRRHQISVEIEAELQRAANAVHPPLKRQLLAILVRNANEKPEKERTRADNEALADDKLMREKLGALELHAAKLKAEIADMDDDELDQWRPAPFRV